MGQYFLVVNTTKKEFLHPHKFGNGLKFLEFATEECSIMLGLAHLLAQSSEGVTHDDKEITGRWIGAQVLIVGDDDESGIFDKASEGNDYTDIPMLSSSIWVKTHMSNKCYVKNIDGMALVNIQCFKMAVPL